jgi:hypothetical protein
VPVIGSQTRTVLSSEPETAMRRPSGGGAKRHRVHPPCVAGQGWAQGGAGQRVPHLHRGVLGPGDGDQAAARGRAFRVLGDHQIGQLGQGKHLFGEGIDVLGGGAGHGDGCDEGQQLGLGGTPVTAGGLEQAAGNQRRLIERPRRPLVGDLDTHAEPSQPPCSSSWPSLPRGTLWR